MQKISTVLAIGLLMLQVALPAVTVFAEETNQTTDTTSQMQESLQSSSESTPATDSSATSGTSTSQTAPTTEVTSESSADAKESGDTADIASDDEEGEGSDDPDPASRSIEPRAVSTNWEDIFTFDYFKLGNEEVKDGDEVQFGELYEVQYKWDTEDLDVKNGDTATLDLPTVFKNWEGRPAADIKLSDGTVVGTYEVNDGKLVFTFNENIETAAVTNGFVGFALQFDEEKFTEKFEQEINFDGKGEKDLTVKTTPAEIETKMSKKGETDSPENAKSITWTVDIVNGGDKLTNGVLKDSLPAGLGEPTEFKVYALTYDVDGKEIGADEVTTGFDAPVINGSEFKMNFDAVPARGGYRVVYTTPIKDYSVSQFTNDATFTHDDGKLDAHATVDGGIRNNPIEKSGVAGTKTEADDSDFIEWTIVVNKNGQALTDASVEDSLPSGLTLDPSSIKIDKNGTDVTAGFDTSKFPIHLGAVAENEVYTITYRTTIDWSQINDGVFQQVTEFVNTATLKDEGEKVSEDDGEVPFDRGKLVEKTGSAKEYTLANNKLTWTVTVNKAGHDIKDAVLTDTIPKGLDIEKSDILINGVPVDPNKVTFEDNADGSKKVIIALGDISDKVEVKYTTDVNDFSENSFTNGVGLTGDGIGEGPHKDDEKVTVPANAFGKAFKEIDYENKTIKWELAVNPLRQPITSLTITDTFPNNGLVLLTDGFTVTLGNDVLVPGVDYTLTPTNGGQDGFVLVINKTPIDKRLSVTYNTTYDPDIVNVPAQLVGGKRLYQNKAVFTGETKDGKTFTDEKSAQKEVNVEAWGSGFKKGALIGFDSKLDAKDRRIGWDIYFNYNKQALGDGVIVTDKIDYPGQILADTVKILPYSVNKDGKETLGEPALVLGDDYSVDVSEDGQTLTVAFLKDVSERYVISYQTTVPDISLPAYKNQALVKTDKGEFPYQATVTYNKASNHLNKEAIGNPAQVYIGDELNWKISANEGLSVIKNAVISDTLSDGLTYKADSLVVKSVSGDTLVEGTDYTLTTKKQDNGTTLLTVEFIKDLTKAVTIEYTTIVTADNNVQVNNTVDFDGTGIENVSKTTNKITAKQFSWVGGQFREDRGVIGIKKVDQKGNVITSSEAKFELYRVLDGDRILLGEYSTTKGVLEIPNLPLGDYVLVETDAPDGYRLTNEEISVTVDKVYGKDKYIVGVDVKNISDAKISIPVVKEWKDADNQDGIRPTSIEVALLANGKSTDVANLVLTAENNWQGEFTDLPALDEAGATIEYGIKEVKVENGYTSESTGSVEEGFTITNSRTPSKIEVEVMKDWQDNKDQDGIRPESITVQLFADGEATGKEKILSAATNWQAVFTDLDEFKAGTQIVYTVVEKEVAGYTAEVTGTVKDGYVVTNTHKPEVIELSGEKTWDDNDNQDGKRPESISVRLLANGREVANKVVTAGEDGKWTYTFTDLPKFEAGKAINYTVQEDVVKEYTTVVNGLDIKNTHIPGKTSVNVVKAWNDNSNQDGLRKESIKVRLLANGEATDNVIILNASNNWQGQFTDLDEYKAGNLIEYSVEEVDVPEGYEVSLDGTAKTGYILTNSHTPEVTELSGTKTWDDAENQDGKRPDEITVRLFREYDGKEVAKQVVTAGEDGTWSYTFTNLPKFHDGGKEISYQVKEDAVKEYQASYEADNIINTHTPGLVGVDVMKVWTDNNNQDGKRPEFVKVRLVANGEATDNVIVLNASNNWRGQFTDLDEYKAGNLIEYSVEEVDVPEGYEVSLGGTAETGYILTNNHDPELIDLSGSKTWDDAENQDGKRPESITVRLLADGTEVATQEVTAGEDITWTYTFTDLPKFADGEVINYTVQENTVKDYSTVIDGLDITNSYTPGKTSVNVIKDWSDNKDQDGKRPESINVRLLANGEATDNVIVLNADSNWQGQFTDLDEYKEGKLIEYSVEEVDVPEGYEVSLDGTAKTGYVLTNSHTPEVIELTGEKTWNDNNNQDGKRPDEITVRVFRDYDGKQVAKQVVKAAEDDTWTYSFENLPKYYDGGKEIGYQVKEDNVEGYQAGYDVDDNGVTNIVNSHTPGVVSIDVMKVWNDKDNQDGLRPDEITVQLLADGKVIDEQKVTMAMNWRYIFTDLDEYKDGKLIEYSIKEVDVPEGYESSINGSVKEGFTITNTHKPTTPEKEKKPTNKPSKGQKYGKLPQTGESQNMMLMVLGFALILLTTSGYVVYKRKS